MITFFKEYIQFVRENKKWFMIPFLLFVIIISSLVYIGTSSTVTPFIYTLF